MLSAMTTSENFSLGSQSRCSSSSCRDFGSSTRDECRDYLLDGGFAPRYDTGYPQHESAPNSIAVSGNGVVAEDMPESELETDISELLEQLDLDDVVYDQSGPLKIVSQFDTFALNASQSNYKSLDEFCMRIARENKRASHHLSGGGLLCDTSVPDAGTKSRFCTLSDAGSISTENIFDFDDLSYFDVDEEECKASYFLNQISPSSPLTVTKANNSESTNPFNNIHLKGALEREAALSSTNPFRSSPEYENLSVPRKSFSQCSTRPASPVNCSEEPCISNPFLLNETSPRSCPSVNLAQFFVNDYPKPQQVNPSGSFIFAVPVFPVFQHQIANSSTQTTNDPPESTSEPVYHNVTNQLRKFMQKNNHSEHDLQCLKTTMKDLRNSGWYYENVSWQESVVLLKDTEPGTFLIRDSSDPNFLFSLSVQTSRGPTSVRLHYVNGQFRLDAEEKLIPHMPSFNSVIELIDYYIENTVKNKCTSSNFKGTAKRSGKDKLQKSKEQVWIDAQGNVYSNILLVKPLHKKEHFSTLQHLTRLAINRHIKKTAKSRSRVNFRVTPVYESSPFQDSSFPVSFDPFYPILNVTDLPLPITLINYLNDYPYCH